MARKRPTVAPDQDIRWALDHNSSIEEIANFLCRTPSEVRQRAEETAEADAIGDPSLLGVLISFGLIAVLIISVFFGIGFSLLTENTKQITRDSDTRYRSTAVLPSLNSDARSVPIKAELRSSAAADALPVAPLAQGSAAREVLTQANREPARDASVSAATGVSSNTETPAVSSPARETTLAPPATGSRLEFESVFPVATTAATPPASPRPGAAEVAEVLARGDSFILIGDIASARVFYKRAADSGDRRAALLLGATFDPAFLSRAGLGDTLGDPAQARSWYRRGFDLDATKAKHRRSGVDRR
jgi:hypothetical protein